MSSCRIRQVFNIFLKGGGVRQTGNNANVDWFLVDCPAEVDFSGWRDWLGIRWGLCYRFSAFWLRSKCSICSYQLNIWYGSHVLSSILIWFLTGDGVLGLALALSQVSLVLQYHQDRPLPHSTPRAHKPSALLLSRDFHDILSVKGGYSVWLVGIPGELMGQHTYLARRLTMIK